MACKVRTSLGSIKREGTEILPKHGSFAIGAAPAMGSTPSNTLPCDIQLLQSTDQPRLQSHKEFSAVVNQQRATSCDVVGKIETEREDVISQQKRPVSLGNITDKARVGVMPPPKKARVGCVQTTLESTSQLVSRHSSEDCVTAYQAPPVEYHDRNHRKNNIRRRDRPVKHKQISVAKSHKPFCPPSKLATQDQTRKFHVHFNSKQWMLDNPTLSQATLKIFYLNNRGVLKPLQAWQLPGYCFDRLHSYILRTGNMDKVRLLLAV